jgi:hypothetical protein
MSGPEAGRTGTAGPVLAGILAVNSAEDVLRFAFDEAQRRAVPLRVLAAGLAEDDRAALDDAVGRWAGKYPGVPASVSVRDGLDPAICLAAAARTSCLAVLTAPGDARATAVVDAVVRRAACPLVILPPDG